MSSDSPSGGAISASFGMLERLRRAAAASFDGIPSRLRPSIGELTGVARGMKPGCRLTLSVREDMPALLRYIRSLRLVTAIAQPPPEALGYGRAASGVRIELLQSPKVRIYAAKTAADCRALYAAEAERADYVAFGRALGYPECCVDAAASHDRSEWDPRFNVWRQPNLTAASVDASAVLDLCCNRLLLESRIAELGPVSPISHYPCSLSCATSAALGAGVLAMVAAMWPAWHEVWTELLEAPMLYWPDDDWPPEFFDEYAGLALVHAEVGPGLTWSSKTSALPLGRGLTPAGPLPATALGGACLPAGIWLESAGGPMVFSSEAVGQPRLLDWRRGVLRIPAAMGGEWIEAQP
jgi:hypothetical protein